MGGVFGFDSLRQMQEWVHADPSMRRALSRLHQALRCQPAWGSLWHRTELVLISEGVPAGAETVGTMLLVLMLERVEVKVANRGGVGGRENSIPRGDRLG